MKDNIAHIIVFLPRLPDMINHDLLSCFTVGICESDQMEIYQIMAAILHLSNVEIKDQRADRSNILVNTYEELFFPRTFYVKMLYWGCVDFPPL